MLYKYENSAVRVMLHRDDYNNPKTYQYLREFSEQNNDILNYALIESWDCWYIVLSSDQGQEEIRETLINGQIFDEDYWEQVEIQTRNQLKVLLKRMDEWIEG